MNMILNSVLLAAVLQTGTDSHVPSYTLDGNIVTFDAEIAFITAEPSTGGTHRLIDVQQKGLGEYIGFNSGDTFGNIQWELSPGEWQFTAYGHADDLANPDRQSGNFTVTVQSPGRSQQILAHVVKNMEAQRDLSLLDPPATRAEIIQAVLDAIANGY